MKKNYIAPKNDIVKCDLHEVILAASTIQVNTGGDVQEASGEISGAKKFSAWDSWEE